MRRINFANALTKSSLLTVFRWPIIKTLSRSSSAAIAGQAEINLVRTISALNGIPLNYTNKQEVLQKITELCQQAMGSHACTLVLVDLESDILTHAAGTGPDKVFEAHMNKSQFKIEKGNNRSLDRRLIEAGKLTEGYDLPSCGQGIANPRVAEKYNLRSGLCYPLKYDGYLLGYLNHFSSKRNRRNPFTPEEKELLKIFADQCVNVIERFEQYQTRDRLSTILHALSEDLLSMPSNTFLNRVAETACELLTVPICIVWRLDENENRLKIASATANVDEEYRKLELIKEEFSKWSHLFRGEIAYLKDVRKKHPFYFHQEEAKANQWVSLLSAPLRADNRLIGMLDVYTERQPRKFKSWEKGVFHVFANYAALAMHKARLQEKQLIVQIR